MMIQPHRELTRNARNKTEVVRIAAIVGGEKSIRVDQLPLGGLRSRMFCQKLMKTSVIRRKRRRRQSQRLSSHRRMWLKKRYGFGSDQLGRVRSEGEIRGSRKVTRIPMVSYPFWKVSKTRMGIYSSFSKMETQFSTSHNSLI